MEAIYREDAGKPIRKSHENPYIVKLYEEFLGKPMSEKAHHLLHTHYFNKKKDVTLNREDMHMSHIKLELKPEQVSKIKQICQSFNDSGELINVLHKTQEPLGICLPKFRRWLLLS
jgi:hypothetical protein